MTVEILLFVLGLSQQPVPRPFPQPGTSGQPSAPAGRQAQPPPATTPRPTAPPAAPAAETATTPPAAPQTNTGAPPEDVLGVKVYPNAQFITSYDAGRGQRFYLYGSTASFIELVTYYRTLLGKRGELIFDAPATHEFETGRFREETMAFPPSVTIKEYKSEISDGYPNPKPGGQPARFPTVIQIVPVPKADR